METQTEATQTTMEVRTETPTPGTVQKSILVAEAETNEALLARLAQAVKRRHRTRRVLKVIYGGGLCLYISGAFYCAVHTRTMGGWFYPLYLMLLLKMVALYLINAAFYKRTIPPLRETLVPLAQRGDERAVGPLLELMDARLSGMGGWGKSRPLFVQSLCTLLSSLTLESFQRLSMAQIHQLTPLLLLPEPELKSAVRDMFVRCGDARGLRALQGHKKLYKFQRLQKWNPALAVMLTLLRRYKKPVLDAEAMAYVDQACNAIQARINVENGAVQLLRASDATMYAAPEQLLRATFADSGHVPSSELVRAVHPEPAIRED